jgi:carboxylesterase type B
VTLVGQSAGAGSISSHLAMQSSRGLFSAAVLESGGFAPWITQNMTNAQQVYQSVLLASSCENLSCLRSLSTLELYSISLSIKPATSFLPTAFIPSVDLVELLTHPWISLSAGNISDVPFISGSNSDEGVSYLPRATSSSLTEFQFFYLLVKEFDFGDFRSEIEELYVNNVTYPVVYDDSGVQYSHYWWATQRFIGDYFFSCPTQYSLDQMTRRRSSKEACANSGGPEEGVFCSDMYAYHDAYVLADRGSFVEHGFNLPLVLHMQAFLTTSADAAMADRVTAYWVIVASSAVCSVLLLPLLLLCVFM